MIPMISDERLATDLPSAVLAPNKSPGQKSPNHWHSQHVMGTFWLHFSKTLEFCIVVFFSLFSPLLWVITFPKNIPNTQAQ